MPLSTYSLFLLHIDLLPPLHQVKQNWERKCVKQKLFIRLDKNKRLTISDQYPLFKIYNKLFNIQAIYLGIEIKNIFKGKADLTRSGFPDNWNRKENVYSLNPVHNSQS